VIVADAAHGRARAVSGRDLPRIISTLPPSRLCKRQEATLTLGATMTAGAVKQRDDPAMVEGAVQTVPRRLPVLMVFAAPFDWKCIVAGLLFGLARWALVPAR